MLRLKTVCFLFFGLCFTNIFAQSESNFQRVKITLDEKDILLSEVLLQAAEKAEFNLSFNPSILEDRKMEEYLVRNETSANIFQNILPENILIRELGNSIVLQRKIQAKATKQKLVLKGKILDVNKNLAVGDALILERSSLSSALSNADGSFTLEVNESNLSDFRITVSKEGFKEVSEIIELDRKDVTIGLVSLSPAELEEQPTNLSKRGFQEFKYARVLIPKKVQLRAQLSPVIFYRKFQFSILPGASTNLKMGGNVENEYSINLGGGYTYGVHTLELGAGFNINRKFMNGWQAAGGFNFVGGEVNGVQLAGGTNMVGEKMKGTQLSGGINFVYGKQKGFQASGGANVVLDSSHGVQLSGGYNQAKTMDGIQITAGLNVALKEAKGLQLAPVNYATHLKGKQIGIVNISDSTEGTSIGLISFARRGGYCEVSHSSDEIFYSNLILKMGASNFYNIYGAGFGFNKGDFIWNYSLGIGKEKLNRNERYFNYELLFSWIQNEDDNSFNDYGLVKTRFLMQNKSHHKVRLSYGPSINLMVFERERLQDADYSDFPPYTLINESAGEVQLQAWVGFQLSIGLRDFL